MFKKIITLAVLIPFILSGCAAAIFIGGAAIGVGGYKYFNGSLIVIYQAPFDKTWDASKSAIESLGYTIYERNRKIASGSIVTTGSVKERVKLSLKYVSVDETEVKIRVGLMGEEETSNKIKDKISALVFNVEKEQ